MFWDGRAVLVTGGASFIGSHLSEALVRRGAAVRVIDNLSTGRRSYLDQHIRDGDIEFVQADLLDAEAVAAAVRGIDTVFHLAADHGGRGYVDLHQAACASNLALDGMLLPRMQERGGWQGRLRLLRLRISESPAARPD